MKIKIKNKLFKLNDDGFTLTEVIIATAVGLSILALVSGIIKFQGNFFSKQLSLNQMETNGRAAIDFLSRSIQNAGYNINRGSRFLAASDYYISTVFDENDNGVIQNDEIITLSVSNLSNQATNTFTISPYFDFDDDGQVDQFETRDYEISLTLNKPPFSIYLFTPNKTDSDTVKNAVVRNIDNLIIRYFDKNNMPLPEEADLDTNGLPIPPYTLSKAELNQIRKIEIEVVVRSNDEDPNRKHTDTGSYLIGSAATQGGSSSYKDHYHRKIFKAVSSPRNLVTAPFGKIILSANPNPINCPDNQATVTANLVNLDGDPVYEQLEVLFNASGGEISQKIVSLFDGEASTTLNYDWSSSILTTTVSASTQIEFEGKNITIYNAIPVTFDGQFFDDFDNGVNRSWVEQPISNSNASRWVAEGGKYRTRAMGDNISTNGCEYLKNYEVLVNVQKTATHTQDNYFGLIFRSPSDLSTSTRGYYMVRVRCFSCEGPNSSNHRYRLELIEKEGSYQNVLTSVNLEPTKFSFLEGEDYTLKVIVMEGIITAKFWKSSELEPSNDPAETPKPADPPEPARNGRTIETENLTYSQGKIGLISNTSKNTFDNVVLKPLS
jgi:prepilin-type N-terminal cleavage/methylation domain-containing protein